MAQHAPDLPEVTDHHRMMAYIIVRPAGVSFEAVYSSPECAILRRVIEAKAHQLRTDAWKEACARQDELVRRCRVTADGSTQWSTQVAKGPWVPAVQPQLL